MHDTKSIRFSKEKKSARFLSKFVSFDKIIQRVNLCINQANQFGAKLGVTETSKFKKIFILIGLSTCLDFMNYDIILDNKSFISKLIDSGRVIYLSYKESLDFF